ncbi:MAG: hypothetical protein WDW36_004153 [Sanguina aurantia]
MNNAAGDACAVSGMLRGCWVLRWDWLAASHEARGWAEERDFVVQGDDRGLGGPMKARQRLLQNQPQLFAGVRFHIPAGEFKHRDKVETLLSLGGARPLSRPVPGASRRSDPTLAARTAASATTPAAAAPPSSGRRRRRNPITSEEGHHASITPNQAVQEPSDPPAGMEPDPPGPTPDPNRGPGPNRVGPDPRQGPEAVAAGAAALDAHAAAEASTVVAPGRALPELEAEKGVTLAPGTVVLLLPDSLSAAEVQRHAQRWGTPPCLINWVIDSAQLPHPASSAVLIWESRSWVACVLELQVSCQELQPLHAYNNFRSAARDA